MRDVAIVARKFIETRADWKRNLLSDGDRVKAGKAESATRALAWTLGIDLDLMDRPKAVGDLSPAYVEKLDVSTLRDLQHMLGAPGPVAIIPIDLAPGGPLGKDGGESPVAAEDRWYLLDVPPRVYADGTRTELWSAMLSGAQLEELREAISVAQLSAMTADDQLTLAFDAAEDAE